MLGRQGTHRRNRFWYLPPLGCFLGFAGVRIWTVEEPILESVIYGGIAGVTWLLLALICCTREGKSGADHEMERSGGEPHDEAGT